MDDQLLAPAALPQEAERALGDGLGGCGKSLFHLGSNPGL